MKTINKIIISAIVAPLFCSCSDLLDVKDNSAINAAIWDSEQSATLYLNYTYAQCLPSFGGDQVCNSSLASLSDETVGMPNMLLGTMSTDDTDGTFSSSTYQAIRYINIALESMKDSKMSQESQNKILGQLYFFRAWQHWKMVNLYGGVPYITNVADFGSDSTAINKARNKTSECIAYLKEDLNKAISMLPSTWPASDYGRITRGAAAAFLGRILMFYASPQFNPNNDQTRWTEAYEANLKAKQICTEDGYGLKDISVASSPYYPVTKDFNKIFALSSEGIANTEAIMVRCYSAVSSHGYEASVRPVDQTGKTTAPSNQPSWDLVKAFPMSDGRLTSDPASSWDSTYFYKNRDPRFYATVAYNGCYWSLGGSAARRQWTYKSGEPVVVTAGTMSQTGFYCRKMVDPVASKTDAADQINKTETNWIEIRYAEVLLNLAECAFEAGHPDDGYAQLVAIRSRAGIEPGADGFYGLKSNPSITPIELVMNERRIEFAFEGKRFWDLRRRNMFSGQIGSYTRKLNGWLKAGSQMEFKMKNPSSSALTQFAAIRDTMNIDLIYKNYVKMAPRAAGSQAKVVNYLYAPQPGDNARSYNFLDVPLTIINRCPSVEQTLGWSGGKFNPLD